MNPIRTPRHLLALTPGEATRSRDVPELLCAIGRAFEGGLPAVLIREPGLSDGDLAELSGAVVEVARRFEDGWGGGHDSVHVALSCGAHGVHLGFRSLPLAVARELVERRCALGFSAHAHDDRDVWELADYLTFGPVRPTPSKAGLVEPTGFDGLESAARSSPVPLFALGGMRPEDASLARRAGAAGVAVLSRILGAEDPRARTAEYLAALGDEEERP